MVAMHLKVIVLGLGHVLANRESLDESSVLHVKPAVSSQLEESGNAQKRAKSWLEIEESSTCIGGACAEPEEKPKGPPVNPNANCEGIDCTEVCEGPLLSFTEENLEENSLAGKGYWGGGGTMKIANVAPGIDMFITDEKGNYDRTSSKYHRKYRAGKFMQQKTGMYVKSGVVHDVIRIAMEKPQDYEFKFQLKDKSGQPATMEEFPLVFYDMDYYESVKACGVAGAVADEQTDLTSTWSDEGESQCVTFKAGYKSAESPDNFDAPTRDQARASAAFIYENASEWTMKFALKYYSHRWVLFKSSKALSCQTEGGE
jgi:hypothetical protein